MEKQNPIITFLMEEKILDEKTLKATIDQQQKTGHSLISILKNENLLDEDQLTRVVATANNIEFVNLSSEMVDPMVAHLVSYEVAIQHNVIPMKKQANQLLVWKKRFGVVDGNLCNSASGCRDYGYTAVEYRGNTGYAKSNLRCRGPGYSGSGPQ
jgi:hypothetical protein